MGKKSVDWIHFVAFLSFFLLFWKTQLINEKKGKIGKEKNEREGLVTKETGGEVNLVPRASLADKSRGNEVGGKV